MRPALTAVLAALCVLVAGCSGGGKEPATAGGASSPDDGPVVTVDEDSPYGAIRGVVVDDAIRPLDGVLVAIAGSERTATSANGIFVFADLLPGDYILQANLTGHESGSTSVTVEAGKVAAPRVQLLALVSGSGAYHYTVHTTGYIQASAALGGAIVDAFFDSFGFLAPDNPFCNHCVTTVDTPGLNVSTFVTEAVWDNTVPPVTSDALFLAVLASNFTPAGPNYGEEITSPFLRHLDTQEDYFPDHERTTYVRFQVSGGLQQPNLQQQYDLYITIFVNGAAPQGWSLVDGSV